ncbi:hypothetical protein [Streptomyces sp. NPDC002490]|uniref:tetratricopeptide repeat protein n=1 Tax=Streptomyces sp. NPDC002490 TaxID=3154416 RepID=UPI003317DCA1
MLTWSGEEVRSAGRALSAFLLREAPEPPTGAPEGAPEEPGRPRGSGAPAGSVRAAGPDGSHPPSVPELVPLAVAAVLALRRRALLGAGGPLAPECAEGAGAPAADPYRDGGLTTRLIRAARAADSPDGPALADLLRWAARLWTGSPVPAADAVPAPLAPVRAAATHPGPDPDAPRTADGTPLLTALARAALDTVEPRSAHRVATAVRDWGPPAEELRPHLAPLDELRRRAAGLVSGAPGAAAVPDPLRTALEAALDAGDLPRAEAAVEHLAREHRRLTVTHRLAEAERALAAVPGPAAREGLAHPDASTDPDPDPVHDLRLHLRTARMYLAAGDLDTTEQYLDLVTRALAPAEPPITGPPAAELSAAAPPAPAVAGPAPAPGPAAVAPGGSPVLPSDPLPPAAALLDRTSPGAGDVLRATVGDPHRWRLWHHLARDLEARGDTEGAAAVYALGRPPVPPPGPRRPPVAPYPELELVPLLDEPPGDAPVDRSPAALADHYARAVAEGSPVALGRAAGWYVRAGDPGAGLELYRAHAHEQYFGAAAVWNLACAYAAVGAESEALHALHVFARILPGATDPGQRAALDAYCARRDTPSPLPRAPAPEPDAAPAGDPDGAGAPGTTAAPERAPGAGAPVDEPALAARAKELHDGGRTDEAVTLLEELLAANPSAPAAYLLMRIHRERGDLPAARVTVHRIAGARGDLSWRHHVELARVALDRRCTDLDEARTQLARARAKGAGPHWTQPLEERLDRASGHSAEAPLPPRGRPDPPAHGRGHHGPGPEEPGVAQALREGRLPELLAEARSGAPRPGRDLATVLAHLRTLRLSVPPPATLDLVIEAVMEVRDDYAARDLATWLMDHRYWDEAVEVLQSCVPWISPERLPRVVHLRDRAARAGGVLEELDPVCPPVREDAGQPVRADRREIPPHLVVIVEPEASLLPVWRAQNPPTTATPDDRADLWVEAVRAHPVAFGNALGHLVAAGRAEDALRLHSTYAEELWLTAGAAWNLGCAYAATGRLPAAAAAFAYQARVATRPHTAPRLQQLTALFDEVGRPVPHPPHSAPRPAPVLRRPSEPGAAPSPPRAALHITEAESTAARLVAQCRNEPSTHHFRLAADAVRKAIRLDPSGRERHAAALRELFALRTPEPASAAALAMVLETAQLTGEAWELLARWIDERAAHPELLGPAVRIARRVDRVGELREALLRHLRPESGFEHHLTLAKASHELDDPAGRTRHARRTLNLNPSCAEAAYLLDPRGRAEQAEKAGHAPPVPVDAATPRAEAVALLARAYATDLDPLDRYALTRLRPATHRTALRATLREGKKGSLAERVAPPALLADAEPMLTAAAAGDWEAAAVHARALVSGRPWHMGVANAAAMCLIRLHDLPEVSAAEKAQIDEEVRGLAAMAGDPRVRRDVLVRLAFARGRYEEAEGRLGAVPRWQLSDPDVWALAALRAGASMCARPAAAAALLLEHGRLRAGVPGRRATAVAAVLAARAGDDGLTEAAITAYRRAEERARHPADLVTDALAVDFPEVLNSAGSPVLPPAQVDRVVAHLAEDPPRLLGFLRRTGHHTGRKGPEQRRELVARRLHLFEAYAASGRIGAALGRLAEAEEYGAGRRTVSAPLERLCARHGHPDPAGAARALLDHGPGAPGAHGARGSAQRTALTALAEEIAATPPDLQLPDRVARFLTELARGVDPLARVVVARLAPVWDEQARLVLAAARLVPVDAADPRDPDGDPVAGLIVRTTAVLAESDPLAEDVLLGRGPYGACVRTVQRALRAHWERSVTLRFQQGVPVLSRSRATRIGDGPVEAVFELRTGQQPPRAAEVRRAGAAQGWESHEPPADAVLQGLLVVEGRDARAAAVTLELRWRFADQGWSQPVRYEVPVETLPRRDAVGRRFDPKARTGREMFVGRRREKAQLRRTFAYVTESPVSPQLITGSRRVGKTSLIEDLRRLDGPTGVLLAPAQWPVPHLFPLLVSGQSAPHPVRDPLRLVIAEADSRLRCLYPDLDLAPVLEAAPPAGAGPTLVPEFASWWEAVRRRVWPGEAVKPLVVVDECQELLRGYRSDTEAKRQATGVLRDLGQRGEIALLFSGSCTYAQLQALLAGTLIGTDISAALPIGLLDSSDALQVIHLGFPDERDGFSVEVLNGSAVAAYEATLGHPYHLHLLGEALATSLEERGRRVVDPPLVHEAVRRVVDTEGAVTGLLDQYDAPGPVPLLLFEVADRLKDSRTESALKEGWSQDKCEELADYIDLGLLRREGGNLAWVNPIVERWFDGDRLPASPQDAVLHHARLEVTRRGTRDGHLVYQVRDPEGVRYRATHLADGDPQAVARRFNEVARATSALPERWAAHGSWLLQPDVTGRSLDHYLNPKERVPVREAVRWIIDVCRVLDAVHRHTGLPHGDIHPDHLARDGEVRITGWGHSGTFDQERPGVSLHTWTSDYYGPQCQPGGPRTTRHDTVALAALLHQLLDEERRLPWPTGPTAHGVEADVIAEGPVGDVLHAVLAQPRHPRHTSPAALAEKLQAALLALPEEPEPEDTGPPAPVVQQLTFHGPVGAVTGAGAQVDVGRVGDPGDRDAR